MKIELGDIIKVRGCIWDEGGEYDAPIIIYSPFLVTGIGGNSGDVENFIEDCFIDLMFSNNQKELIKRWKDEVKKECEWRGWNIRGFKNRKNARHVEVEFKIVETSFANTPSGLFFGIENIIEQKGPFKNS